LTNVEGKTCVITGATSGIGLTTAHALAALGFRLVLVGRDPARGDAALGELRARAPRLQAEIRYADLSRLDETRRLGAELGAALQRIDILINNAGALFQRRSVTADGLERTFALNHMAYFVLIEALRQRLVASAPARIINVASEAHRRAKLDFDDLQSERNYRGLTAYGRSKLCNILFTRELARRLAGTDVSANCLHPGFVATRFGDGNGGLFRAGLSLAKGLFAISPARGALTSVHVATSPEVDGITGKYFDKCAPATPSPAAEDDAAARRLWQESARLAGLPATA
jgi:NAD(P)-dependent dehydrogenase (short-subunit alcohol dehydrogenase family)